MTFDSCYLKLNKQDLVRWNYTHKMLRDAGIFAAVRLRSIERKRV